MQACTANLERGTQFITQTEALRTGKTRLHLRLSFCTVGSATDAPPPPATLLDTTAREISLPHYHARQHTYHHRAPSFITAGIVRVFSCARRGVQAARSAYKKCFGARKKSRTGCVNDQRLLVLLLTAAVGAFTRNERSAVSTYRTCTLTLLMRL